MVTTIFGQSDQDFISYGKNSLPLLKDLLAIPNDAHYPKDIELNVQWCEREFLKRGFSLTRLETPTVPLLLGEKKAKQENAKTVLIYLQIDGQPVDPNFWFQENPYQATLKERTPDGDWQEVSWNKIEDEVIDPELRIFARSTSDSKGAVVMFLTALDMMSEKEKTPDFNMKVIMDFEEELGSPNLPEAVQKNTDLLSSDMLIIFDGPRHLKNEPTLTFGARGIIDMTIKVFGPYFPQHSGHYGNYVPNPAVRLSQLIASMKDSDGRVTIPGFYDGIDIEPSVKKILDAVPDDEQNIKNKMGIASPDKVGKTYQEALQYPSLNVRGMLSGWVGEETRTIVPSSATAEIDIRLVLESDPDRLIGLVRDHIINQGYHIVDSKPTTMERAKHDRICQFSAKTSYKAYRTDFDSEVGVWLVKGMKKAFKKDPIMQRTSGGSIPISPFVIELGIPAVTVPTVNRDNNQHSPNENIRLGNYFDGIKTMYSVLTEPLGIH
jgi:acetylornithine deacetylase/succinyl-diaminopimelate desuccinylase-like protein